MTLRSQPLIITCARGLADPLAAEVRMRGIPVTDAGPDFVAATGGWPEIYQLNLWLQTGNRALWRVGAEDVLAPEDVPRAVGRLAWEEWLPADGYFTVRAAVAESVLRDPRQAALRVKDAIVDRIRARRGRRPDSGGEDDRGAAVFARLNGTRLELFLDTSGRSLSQRGYRLQPWRAPLRETLAAGIVGLIGWDGRAPFVNPMCGSGTLGIEAALRALNRAPGLLREHFAFRHLLGHDEAAWQAARRTAAALARPATAAPILLSDIAPGALRAAAANAARAGVADALQFARGDFADTPVPPDGGGVVLLNPEYGERLGADHELAETYRRIGDFFKQRCGGYRGYVFTGNLPLAKRIGLRSARRLTLFNGPLECRLLEFELYAGTRKPRAAEADSAAAGPTPQTPVPPVG